MPASFAGLTPVDSTELANQLHPNIQAQLVESPQFPNDITVIGAGPGGYVAAIRAAQLGARVVIVEKGEVGGTCLNVGCIPTKVLLACVAVLDHVKYGAEFGVTVNGFDVDIAAMMKRKAKTVKQLTGGVEALFKKNKIKLVRGHGRITDSHTVSVDTGSGIEEIKTGKILICTGSEPARLPIPNLEIGGNVWTSTEALEFDKAPKKILIIGAGAIGLEAGYTLARLGTDVTVVEMMPQILPAADSETAKELQKHLERAGMKFRLNSTVTKAENTKTGKKIFIKAADSEDSDEYDTVLVAVGRRPLTNDIGLETVGVKCERGKILVDEHMRTNIPSIYAAGDCIGEPMLAHVAWTESVVAIEHAMGLDAKIDLKAFPACVYTTPECASVGLTEGQARERLKDVRVGKFGFSHNGKAMGIGEAHGFIKFVSDGRYGQILGVHMVGPHVTDMIAEATLAIKNELTVDEVIATIHPHPTLSEVVQEAAMDVEGRAVHK